MKLKFISNGKLEQGIVLIGKTGQMRFKSAIADSLKFIKNERWLVGFDEDEKPIKNIYVIRPKEDNKHNGFKMQYQNKSWFISAITISKELNLNLPVKCKFEILNTNEHKGLKLTIQ